jgi:hypothetical protein
MRPRVHRPPPALRRARMDNLALVPGSMLPYIRNCQEIANRLPANGVLIVVPEDNPAQKETLLRVARLIAREGHQVRVLSAAELSRPPKYVQPRLDEAER